MNRRKLFHLSILVVMCFAFFNFSASQVFADEPPDEEPIVVTEEWVGFPEVVGSESGDDNGLDAIQPAPGGGTFIARAILRIYSAMAEGDGETELNSQVQGTYNIYVILNQMYRNGVAKGNCNITQWDVIYNATAGIKVSATGCGILDFSAQSQSWAAETKHKVIGGLVNWQPTVTVYWP